MTSKKLRVSHNAHILKTVLQIIINAMYTDWEFALLSYVLAKGWSEQTK